MSVSNQSQFSARARMLPVMVRLPILIGAIAGAGAAGLAAAGVGVGVARLAVACAATVNENVVSNAVSAVSFSKNEGKRFMFLMGA